MQDFTFTHHLLKAEVADVQKNEHHIYNVDLPGVYQIKNIVTVLAAIHQLAIKKMEY